MSAYFDSVIKFIEKVTPPNCNNKNQFGYITCATLARSVPFKQVQSDCSTLF